MLIAVLCCAYESLSHKKYYIEMCSAWLWVRGAEDVYGRCDVELGMRELEAFRCLAGGRERAQLKPRIRDAARFPGIANLPVTSAASCQTSISEMAAPYLSDVRSNQKSWS